MLIMKKIIRIILCLIRYYKELSVHFPNEIDQQKYAIHYEFYEKHPQDVSIMLKSDDYNGSIQFLVMTY